MFQSESNCRAIIAELHPSSALWWTAYHILSILFLACIYAGSITLYWTWLVGAGILFLFAFVTGAFATILSLARDQFVEPENGNNVRFFSILFGAAFCAAGYGMLETLFTPAPGAIAGPLQTVAKSLASFISAIGFAGVFAAFSAELTGGRKYPFSMQPVEYTIQNIVFTEKNHKQIKHMYFIDSRGKLEKLSVTISQSNWLLSETTALAAQVREGDKVEVIESRQHRFIVKVKPKSVAKRAKANSYT